ncbi:hypothetical protein BIY24_16075 [Halobacteriovorax marinus]|uniref:Membrane protein n=1 Tax=Halobacteriovorax marinus (strain ATCC BAA-682 / DSM 15412 / SJ) TaxID=862908 RepID=E1X172_HALMS|nr:hypothetical protein [Halobacteriovorax marinus]ATH09402.1 hypothetical protein BIY24_16075 [Halobacteriovorax marinus]CBW28142.1 putative membrane protein [Halobacteriovorax marinus SJ]
MKSLLTLKTLTGFLTASSVLVGVKAVRDANFNSSDFMNKNTVQVVKRLDDQKVVRHVASETAARPAVQYLPMNELNSSIINGEWEIRRIQDENNEVVFNANEESNKVEMNFELVGTSLVKVGEEEPMILRVSYLDESGRTIALFRQFGKGYEIIEAIKKVEVKEVAAVERVENTEKVAEENTTGVVIERVQDLVLERALHPSKDPNVLRGESVVSGNIVVGAGRIEEFNVVVGIGKNYEQPLGFINSPEIKAGGQFSAETNSGEVTGIITNNGKDGFRVRFATGPLQGAMLNFVTIEKMDELNAIEEEAAYAKEEMRDLTSDKIEVIEDQRDAEFSRSAQGQNIYEIDENENYEEEEVIEPETEEEFARITEERGFSFGQVERAPASK